MSVRYTRVGWQDAPSTDTPIDAANLNHMDNGILALSEEVDTELPLLQEQINDISTDIDTQIDEKVPPEVSSWLTEHVDPVGSAVVVDDSLTIQGAAADAKKTGDEISDLKDGLTAIESDVTDLKEDINDITKTIYNKNIWNADITNVTTGKYLNPNTGNEGTNASYMYYNDYVPIEADTQYYATVWLKSDGTLAGAFGGFVIFYDENKTYIGGLTGGSSTIPFTTPANCAFVRLSDTTTGYNNRNIMIEKGATYTTPYVPYLETKILKLPFVIVDINGNGDFTSINRAVQAVSNGATIVVCSGEYVENVKAWGKEIHIIGINRETCIIKDTSGDYSTPPLEIGAGSIQNMSIIEEANGAGTANMGAYAVHVESNNLYNKKLLIRNCYIYSDSSSAIGMGLRGGCSVRIEDCEIICAGARASTGAAPLYFHDADAQAYWGTANLYLHNNVLRNTASTLFSMLTINSIHKENTTYMHMMYNIFVRSKTSSISQKYNTWNTSGNTDADGWNGLSHMYLEDDSFGNNQTELNYSA